MKSKKGKKSRNKSKNGDKNNANKETPTGGPSSGQMERSGDKKSEANFTISGNIEAGEQSKQYEDERRINHHPRSGRNERDEPPSPQCKQPELPQTPLAVTTPSPSTGHSSPFPKTPPTKSPKVDWMTRRRDLVTEQLSMMLDEGEDGVSPERLESLRAIRTGYDSPLKMADLRSRRLGSLASFGSVGGGAVGAAVAAEQAERANHVHNTEKDGARRENCDEGGEKAKNRDNAKHKPSVVIAEGQLRKHGTLQSFAQRRRSRSSRVSYSLPKYIGSPLPKILSPSIAAPVSPSQNETMQVDDGSTLGLLTPSNNSKHAALNQTASTPQSNLTHTPKAKLFSPTSSSSTLKQEYNVDHSCSTPLERLARDVGNTLRQWNVHSGCDRHVSLDWMEKMELLKNSDGVTGRDDKMTKDVEDTEHKSNAPPQSRQSAQSTKFSSPPRGAQCIRKKAIPFQTIGYEPQYDKSSNLTTWIRRRYNIPLVLALWDAPRLPHRTVGGVSREHCTRQIDFEYETTPHSLRPDPSPTSYALLGVAATQHLPPVETGLGQDLSALFNIGQHITLTLDLECVHRTDNRDVESMYNDMHSYITGHIQSAQQRQRIAVKERQRRWKLHRREIRRREMKQRKKQWRLQKRRQRHKRQYQESYDETDIEDEPLVEAASSMSCDLDDSKDTMEEVVFHEAETGEKTANAINKKNSAMNDESEDDDDSDDDDDEDDNSSNSEFDLTEDEHLNLHLRRRDIHREVSSSLSSVLQTALNLAASENDCRLPVFGFWGNYHGSSRDEISTLYSDTLASPSWIPAGQRDEGFDEEKENNSLNRWIWNRWSSNTKEASERASFQELLLSSPSICGTCQAGKFRSSHRVYSISERALPPHLTTLHGLSCVLLTQAPHITSPVMLTAARHFYQWQQQKGDTQQSWRSIDMAIDGCEKSSIDVYRDQCRRRALSILERASSPWDQKSVPMWGPDEGNPLLSVSASVSWGAIPLGDASEEGENSQGKSPVPPPILNLPLKVRSRNFDPIPSELHEMEQALQSATFNPIGLGSAELSSLIDDLREPSFLASAHFDCESPSTTLSAHTRCLLAALLRCGSLGLEALPGHLTSREVLTKLGKHSSQSEKVEEKMTESERVLRKAMYLAGVGMVTTRLVDSMDWADIDQPLDRDIAEALKRVGSAIYPAPPEEVFSGENVADAIHFSIASHPSQRKASPPGRLLSILFAHMARFRKPPLMMRLWLSFVEELRSRWDLNESLPNLGSVPGLDHDKYNIHGQPHWGLNKAGDHRVLGHRANLAAFVNSSEPEPDRDQCIINQKLQVFNICIECKLSTEALHQKQMEKYMSQNDTINDQIMTSCNSKDSESDDEFFDPEEEEVPFADDVQEDGSNQIEAMLKIKATALNSSHNRLGARCPVPDSMPLMQTGGQLYAPYLQRTLPMTDEEEEKQKKLMASKAANEDKVSIQSRIAISQRLQKPKLLSDMSSFKAANPGAVFEDFVLWYGNPENPLNEEVNGETARSAYEARLRLPPDLAKKVALEEASAAIQILMSLRTFWEDTWEEAEPRPAFEQEPLFDPYSTVEMVLHSFETIHPALLMNQALAVNFASAKFVLEMAAEPAIKISSINQTMMHLSTVINDALESLTKDASQGFLFQAPTDSSIELDPLFYVSTSTIVKCETACDIIGEVEVMLSRALALLNLFPHEYNLVDDLLKCRNGDFVFVKHPNERNSILTAMKRHQDGKYGIADTGNLPAAAMREYVIRNSDAEFPCQLSARLIDGSASNPNEYTQSLLLALTCCKED